MRYLDGRYFINMAYQLACDLHIVLISFIVLWSGA